MSNKNKYKVMVLASLPLLYLEYLVISNPGTMMYKFSMINLGAFIFFSLFTSLNRSKKMNISRLIWFVITTIILIVNFLIESGRI